MSNIFETLHQRYIDPVLKKWAHKTAEYSLTKKGFDMWLLPRWMHHFVIKGLLQGVWPIPVAILAPMLLHFALPVWAGCLISVAIMTTIKRINYPQPNALDEICDTVCQIIFPVAWAYPLFLIVLIPIYLVTYPYASP